jgi:ABC-type lipoprotein release transport system permease subunit
MTSRLAVILRIAWRNIWLYRVKTIVIGGLLGSGAFILILGLSMTADVAKTLQASISGSIVGDLQIYSSKAKDKLTIFGSSFVGQPDIGVLSDIAPIRDQVLQHPNVEALIPMGFDTALLARGNELDDAIDAMRQALKSGNQDSIDVRKADLRFRFAAVRREIQQRRLILGATPSLAQADSDLERAQAPEFLATLTAADEDKLQFLETHIAPISGDKPQVYVRYMGTDSALFRSEFPKFRLISGEPLAAGQRGIMLSHKFREEQLKHPVARHMDQLQAWAKIGYGKLADDPELRNVVLILPKQTDLIVRDLSPTSATQLSTELSDAGFKGEATTAHPTLDRLALQLKDFLTVDEANVTQRSQWFYAHIAPKIALYAISPGQNLVLRGYTRSGFVKSLALKVTGIYTFTGLEDSELAGMTNIIDLISFRELFGEMTGESQAELTAMRAAAGSLADVSQADAEAAFFSSPDAFAMKPSQVPGQTSGGDASGESAEPTAQPLHVQPAVADHFDPAEVKSGLALNAAVIVKDKSAIAATKADLAARFAAQGLELQVIDWREASGYVGQFADLIRVALGFAAALIFLVALLIINNSIVTGVFQRLREIGTMRAIGAQKAFVTNLFLIETGVTSLLGTLIGTALALGILAYLGKTGIPASNGVAIFLFSGPALYPHLHWSLILGAPALITLLATLSSFYAARHAGRVRPIEAMQEKE